METDLQSVFDLVKPTDPRVKANFRAYNTQTLSVFLQQLPQLKKDHIIGESSYLNVQRQEVLSEDEQPPEKRKEEYEDSNLVELPRSDIDRFVRDPPEPKVWGDLHWATPTAKEDAPMH